MCLNREMLERVEELFDLVTCDENDLELNLAMDSLRLFLERDIDGWTNHTSDTLAAVTSSRLEEIWDLMSGEQKIDTDLRRHFSDFILALERIECGGNSIDESDSCRRFFPLVLLGIAISLAAPSFAFCSVDSTAEALFSKFSSLLSIAAMGGLLWAGFSFVMGKPEARQHLIYAIIGAIVGFGAESIVGLIRSLIH